MLDQIRKSSLKVRWNLREIHIVTQWKSGCVYRTRSLGMIVCAPGYFEEVILKRLDPSKAKNYMVGPVSTEITRLING